MDTTGWLDAFRDTAQGQRQRKRTVPVTVVGRTVQVPENATADEVLERAGIPKGTPRLLTRVREDGQPADIVSRDDSLSLKGGEAFEDIPVGDYGTR